MGQRQPNRRDRLEAILDRDGPTCVWCRRTLDDKFARATTEHVVPRLKGGPSWIENEVAACHRCNSDRGHQSPSAYADACEQRGLDPDRKRLLVSLEGLDARIVTEGGQRRARPYLASQLRRMRGGN